MDAIYFLKPRTAFIRFYYDECAKPFRDIQEKIELGHPPFDDPPYSEDPEPAFLDQWTDAEAGIEVLGHSSVSMLSETLKLYFQTLQKCVIGFSFSSQEESISKKQGFIAAYKAALGAILATDWSDCPARFDVIEQVVLARNRSQHGGDLTSFRVEHEGKTLKKHRRPFFASEAELRMCDENAGDSDSVFDSFFHPAIEVTRDKLFAAIQEADKCAEWIESRMEKVSEWRRARVSD